MAIKAAATTRTPVKGAPSKGSERMIAPEPQFGCRNQKAEGCSARGRRAERGYGTMVLSPQTRQRQTKQHPAPCLPC